MTDAPLSVGYERVDFVKGEVRAHVSYSGPWIFPGTKVAVKTKYVDFIGRAYSNRGNLTVVGEGVLRCNGQRVDAIMYPGAVQVIDWNSYKTNAITLTCKVFKAPLECTLLTHGTYHFEDDEAASYPPRWDAIECKRYLHDRCLRAGEIMSILSGMLNASVTWESEILVTDVAKCYVTECGILIAHKGDLYKVHVNNGCRIRKVSLAFDD